MKKILPFAFVLTACATTYQDGAKSTYIGNGQHEIKVSGNNKTESDAIRSFAYQKAFETCAGRDQGFTVSEKLESVPGFERHWYHGMVNNEAYRMVIRCEGRVDHELEQQFRRPASEK